MPPLPKPPGTVRRRNQESQWRTLPSLGRDGPVPALPKRTPAWLKVTRDWWAQIWRSPMSTQWVDADIPTLVRLARLVDTVNRTDGNKSWTGSQQSNLLSEIRQLEDRFGLSPSARIKLRWTIADEAPATVTPTSNVRRLRAVDPRAVAHA